MTDLEMLLDAVNTINNINVPVAYHDQIGAPLSRVSKNLNILCSSIVKEVQRQEEAKAGEESKEEPKEAKADEESEEEPVDAVPEACERTDSE